MSVPIDFGRWTLPTGGEATLDWWPDIGTLTLAGPSGQQIVAVIYTENEVRRRLDGWTEHCGTRDGLGWLAQRLDGVR